MTKTIATFSPTHRVIINASAKRGYNIITIDINSGLYKKDDVNQNDTLIRVSKDILGEQLHYSGNKTLTFKEILEVGKQFNSRREEIGYKPINFDRVENAYAKSL